LTDGGKRLVGAGSFKQPLSASPRLCVEVFFQIEP